MIDCDQTGFGWETFTKQALFVWHCLGFVTGLFQHGTWLDSPLPGCLGVFLTSRHSTRQSVPIKDDLKAVSGSLSCGDSDDAALMARSKRRAWARSAMPSFRHDSVAHTCHSRGNFSGIVHGETRPHEMHSFSFYTSDLALKPVICPPFALDHDF